MLFTGVVLTVLAAFVVGALPSGAKAHSARVLGASQPIEVHGDWTLKLFDVDGSLARTIEFENALSPFGDQAIAEFISGFKAPGRWSVALDGGADPACVGPAGPKGYVVTEADDPSIQTHLFKTLTLEVPHAGENADAFVLNGTMTAQRTETITRVSTGVGSCEPDTTPTDCTASGGRVITLTDLAEAVDVILNQQVHVEGVLSFQ